MRRWWLVLMIVLVAATDGCRTFDPWEDTRIESEVKARLVAEQAANLTRLGVVSSRGTVYLSGTVPSADEKARAEAIASQVQGVERVVNTLQVRSSAE